MKRILLIAIALLIFAGGSRAGEPPAKENVVVSKLAGSWYAPDRAALQSEIAGYLAAATAQPPADIWGLIVPHAGYRYSGAVAACGYRRLQGRACSRVVVLGPSHRAYLPGLAALPEAAAYRTPLGKIDIDREFVQKLVKSSSRFTRAAPASEGEHSVEIQLPFLQTVLPGAPVVPIVIGQLDDAAAREIAAALAPLIDDRTLVIASSDFTHYGPNYNFVPFTTEISGNLLKLDMGAYALIEKRDPAGFAAYCRSTGATICGRDAVAVLLHLAPAGARPSLLKYDTSGRIMGDFQNSVSYLCAAFCAPGRGPGPGAAARNPASQQVLSGGDRQSLLKLARAALGFYFAQGRAPQPEELGIPISPGMQSIMGAFVTLHENGSLRGCIGEIQPRRPVCQAVVERAIDAAVHDRRFRPVKPQELSLLAIEISALQQPRAVASYRDIVLGKHGIVLTKGLAGAVFLPQVPAEQHWTLEDTLANLSQKAGLEADAWRDGASFQVFEAEVFHEVAL